MADLKGRKRFTHLSRRAGFGATTAEIDAAMALERREDQAFERAVDNLLDYAAQAEVPDRITPVVETELVQWWLERMVRTRRPLLEKMVLFWHDHFATSIEKDGIEVPEMLRQNEFFRANALAAFGQILDQISRDPAMILWLDLNSNRKNSPNENYARELMELFALGIGTPAAPNYSEADIKQATRAFTGYTIGADGNFFFNTAQHDSSTKTVLGKTCESCDQVNAILLQHVRNGRNVCAYDLAAKLFSFFAYPVTPDSSVVGDLAKTFLNAGHSIRALVEAILKSREFSSTTAYRALIKSPVEEATAALRMLGAERVPSIRVMSALDAQGQRLFRPPDVGGWQSGRGWVNVSTVLSRDNMNAKIVNSLGKPELTEAGGQPVATLLQGLTTGTAKVDKVIGLLVDGDLPSTARSALVTYANTATTDEKTRGLFNLVLAQPAYQLN